MTMHTTSASPLSRRTPFTLLAMLVVVPLIVRAAPPAAAPAGPPSPRTMTCSLASAPLVDFGPYDPLGGATLAATGSMTISCTEANGNGNPTNVTLTVSVTPSATTARQMSAGGADVILYELYSDPANTTIWGDGTTSPAITATLSVPTNGTAAATINFYGLITPGGQDVAAAASYLQTLPVSFTYSCSSGGSC